MNRIVHEIDSQRKKTDDLFDIMAALKVADAQAKADNGKEFVTKTDFNRFETKIFDKMDKTDEKLDLVLFEMNKQKGK